MDLVEDVEVECPHCGEIFAIQVDTEEGSYSTIEDCAVCCRPIQIQVKCRPGEVISVDASAA
jgi:phage terminase large subunit GpA-like protein